MPLPFPSGNVSSSPEEAWTMAFNNLSQRIRRYFVRPEPHLQALAYVERLITEIKSSSRVFVLMKSG